MNIMLATCNAKYIHKNLALRWLYTTSPCQEDVILKEYTIKDDVKRIGNEILEMKIDVLCLSCYIWNIDIHKELIHYLKKQNHNLHIIVGGPEVSYDSFELLDQGVDAISIGEGEESVWEYIQMLREGKNYEIAGMYTASYPNKEYRKVELSLLETYETPYFLKMDEGQFANRYFYLETSRGCPYGCTYCLSSADRCVRMFSDAYVFSILEKIKDSDIKQVKLLDRTFNSNPKRALAIARYINEHCVHQIFQFEIVAETLSEELLTFFCEEADVSRFRFEVGVQSFHTKTLTSVGRMQNNERLKEVITRLNQAGCILHVDLIAGLPYEGMESFHHSFDELFALQASEVQLGILKLLKGTKLRSQKEEFGFQFSLCAPYEIQQTKWLTSEELICIHHCAHATEKFWNSGKLRWTLREVLRRGWYTSPFTMFMALGEAYAKLPRPYQPYQLFACVKQILQDQEEKEVDALLLMEYYASNKQRPKRFTQSYVTLDKKKALMNDCLDMEIDQQDHLFRYGLIDIGYDAGKVCYQLVLYDEHQSYPKQYLIDNETKQYKEWKR
ncbi:DUF4080 domain-containing protein [[Eubacterium] hominis]|uniref:B12-binding domain-containing radical SAM protein n=1 Tax=[Eubacterium] hominis TaxID=2764325 RepID=UPI003A4D6BF0